MKASYILALLCLILVSCTKEKSTQVGTPTTHSVFSKHESLRAYEDAIDFGSSKQPRPHKHSFFSFFHRHKKNQAPQSVTPSSTSLTAGMRDSEAIQRATMRPYSVGGKMYYPTKVNVGQTFDGYASWYGPNFHAKRTSNGETYNMYAHTAANKTLPMNTIVKVTNKNNNKSTIVRINDRGPFVANRIIDLSNAAARDIALVGKGVAPVRLEVLGFGGLIAKQYEKSLDQNKQATVLKQEFKVGESQKTYSGGNFSLQMGAFRSQQGALQAKRALQASLKEKSYTTQVVEGIKNNRPIYRVFIKGFKSQDEANDYAKALAKPSILVRE